MMRRLWAVALAVLLAATRPVVAAEGPVSLYRAQAVVTGTEEPERSRGMGLALEEVVVKVTGDATLAGTERLASLRARAPELASRFTYEDRMKGLPVRDEQGTRERPHVLTVWFDPDRLLLALDGLGLKPWAGPRPTVAVWVLINAPDRQGVITQDGAEGRDMREALLEAAERRGLPVRLPGHALVESAARTSMLAGRDGARAWLELMRQHAAGGPLLFGELSLDGEGRWDIVWLLEDRRSGAAGPPRSTEVRSASFDAAFHEGIGLAAGVLSGTRR